MTTYSSILNTTNCVKAQMCNEMSLKCAETYKGSEKPWGTLTKCYSVDGNNLLNSLGQPETSFSKFDFDSCYEYFNDTKKCDDSKEGFGGNAWFKKKKQDKDNKKNLNLIIDKINDTASGENRIYVQTILDDYVDMKNRREEMAKQLAEMNSVNTDVKLQTKSLIYTTLFTTALGTCLLFFFVKIQ